LAKEMGKKEREKVVQFAQLLHISLTYTVRGSITKSMFNIELRSITFIVKKTFLEKKKKIKKKKLKF
jgi:hypothetical protein